VRTVLTIAALTLQEGSRRRVLRSLAVLTAVLLGLSAWGFSEIASDYGGLTSGEAKVAGSTVLNLVMFGFSLIAALGTAFLAGPTLSGEVESGVALAMMTRPIRRAQVLAGKWLGLVAFGHPVTGLLLLAGQTAALLTLGLLFSTAISPMASGIVAVGLFGATWIAGVVGSVGDALGNPSVAMVGTVSRMLLPTDGLWRGAMNSFQDPALLAQVGSGIEESPFLSMQPLTWAYLVWAAVWTGLVLGLAALSFQRRDL
jgi:ABC-type transport system involved in multi-copper enzyme maturation permease subunit